MSADVLIAPAHLFLATHPFTSGQSLRDGAGLSSPSRARKTGPGEEGRLEARASLTDKITGSAGTFADGRVSFSAAWCILTYLPPRSQPSGFWAVSLPPLGGVQVQYFYHMRLSWQFIYPINFNCTPFVCQTLFPA